jgi:enterochelin esterase family protein
LKHAPLIPAPPTSERPERRLPPQLPRPAPVEYAVSPRITALRRNPHLADGFWRTVEATGTPLTEPLPDDPAHLAVTFLWRHTPGTRAVLAMPNKVVDPTDPAGNLLERVPGTDVWFRTFRARGDWRGSYSLCVDDGQSLIEAPEPDDPSYLPWLRTRGRPDPLNSRPRQPPRWDGPPLSVLDLARGRMTEHRLRRAPDGDRRVWLYSPPHSPPPARGDGDLPLLLLFDGEMWADRMRIHELLDRLILEERIPPLAAVLPESLGQDARYRELSCSEDFLGWLSEGLIPWAGSRLPITEDPARTVIAGQSLGGLMSVYAGLRAPERFGRVLSQSGSFWWPGAAGDEPEWLVERAAAAGPPPGGCELRFHLSAGAQEWVALPSNRRLRDALRNAGHRVDYREFNGGHDYHCWQNELAIGLPRLLGSTGS